MQNPAAPPIVLASSSRYRRGLLDRILNHYETVSPGIDETVAEGAEPREAALELARRKAETVVRGYRSALVIGADQLAVLEGRILGKPGDHQAAVEQLLASAGRTVTFFSAVCVLDRQTSSRHEHVDETFVRFRRFDRRLAESYLKHDQPYDCAGSFKVEGAGFVLFESVDTRDSTALIGLPMIWLGGILQELGYLQG